MTDNDAVAALRRLTQYADHRGSCAGWALSHPACLNPSKCNCDYERVLDEARAALAVPADAADQRAGLDPDLLARASVLAIEREAAAPLDVERLAQAAAECGLDFWTPTGNEDQRDGFREMVFDYDGWAAAILARLTTAATASEPLDG